ncbi:MAG: amidohydrolase [Halobacteriales archaeon]
MTAAADLVLTNAELHTLADPDEAYEAVAVRDGTVVRLGSAWEVDHLVGVRTDVIDLEGRVLLPGFVDAHTHMTMLGQYLVHADLRAAEGPGDCIEQLREPAEERDADDWVLGFGFDESGWAESRYLTREDLDAVSRDRPVAAFREDMHVAAVNSAALERHREKMPDADVRTAAGEPTGVLVEEAIDVIYRAIEPDREETRELLRAAQAAANRRGVTMVHDMVRQSNAPGVYRALERSDELTLRVRLNYWSDHLDALIETGLATNDGSGMVQVGAIKTYTDGSIGGRTATVDAPYADGEGSGQWVVPPAELEALVERADEHGFQLAAHAIGDVAVDTVLDAYPRTADPGGARHRIEHAELTSEGAIERMADLGVVASVQPNFLKWARPGGLYEQRLGPDRGTSTNRYREMLDAGVDLAFGSDGMPLDPLFGVARAVNHPTASQQLTVTEALRAYTAGGAHAGFDEGRLGAMDVGTRADFVALSRSPWATPATIDEIDVALTVVDGDVVYDDWS